MKKMIYGILIFFMSLGLYGCAEQNQTNINTLNEDYVFEGGFSWTNSYSDKGVIRACEEGRKMGVCFYYNPETEVQVPLCTKINCEHQGYSFSDTAPSCDACFGESVLCARIYGNYIYYVSNMSEDGLFKKHIYRANLDGTNRKLLGTMDEAQELVCGIYEGDYLVYTYKKLTTANGEALKKTQAGIYIYDIKNNVMNHFSLEEQYELTVFQATIVDNEVYYFTAYMTEDLTDKSYEEIVELTSENYLETIRKIELWKYDLKSKQTEKIKIMDFVNGKKMLGFSHAVWEEDGRVYVMDLLEHRLDYFEHNLDINDHYLTMAGNGIVVNDKKSFFFWSYSDKKLIKIAETTDGKIMVPIMVGNKWIYARGFETMDVSKIYCLSKDKFMRGEFEWIELPEVE